jgi:hypothetical protein
LNVSTIGAELYSTYKKQTDNKKYLNFVHRLIIFLAHIRIQKRVIPVVSLYLCAFKTKAFVKSVIYFSILIYLLRSQNKETFTREEYVSRGNTISNMRLSRQIFVCDISAVVAGWLAAEETADFDY